MVSNAEGPFFENVPSFLFISFAPTANTFGIFPGLAIVPSPGTGSPAA